LKRITFGDPLVGTGPLPSELNPFMLVEAMSQTAALAAARPAQAGSPRVGFLAAVRDFRVERAVVPGDTLAIRAEVLGRFGRLVKVQGTVQVDGDTIGSAELTLSVPEEVESG
jgi:3-hydroxymyristoyl/3-hydroxydecanoyl-(acyl carrier protein) dehydratase